MAADLLDANSELSRDLSPEWLDLSSRVRRLAIEAQAGTPTNPALAEQALQLCDHVERLHSDVEQILASLNEHEQPVVDHEIQSPPPPQPGAIDEANIQIQREMHQKSDLKQIIKALFMWKDDPVERVRGHVD